jgi:hypothetical protein
VRRRATFKTRIGDFVSQLFEKYDVQIRESLADVHADNRHIGTVLEGILGERVRAMDASAAGAAHAADQTGASERRGHGAAAGDAVAPGWITKEMFVDRYRWAKNHLDHTSEKALVNGWYPWPMQVFCQHLDRRHRVYKLSGCVSTSFVWRWKCTVVQQV